MWSHADPIKSSDTQLQVLFCTRHFPFGFQFTKEALQDDAGVEVRMVMTCFEIEKSVAT